MKEDLPQKKNYLLEGRPLRNPSVSVYQLVVVWEAALGFSEFFFKTLQNVCPFHDGWLTSAPAYTALYSVVFDPKWNDPHASPSLVIQYHPEWLFFCYPRWKKSSKGNILLMWKRRNKKWQKHWKASKSMSSKTVLSCGKNVSMGELHQRERSLKVTEEYTFFFK